MRSRQLRDNLHFITRHKFFDRLIQLFLPSSQIHCFFICLQLLPFLTLFLVVWIIKSGWRFLSWIDGHLIYIPRVNVLWKVFRDSSLFCSTAALELRGSVAIWESVEFLILMLFFSVDNPTDECACVKQIRMAGSREKNATKSAGLESNPVTSWAPSAFPVNWSTRCCLRLAQLAKFSNRC